MTTGNPSKRKLIVAAILAFGVTPVLMAENAWRIWSGGDGVAGGDGIWTADSLTWSAKDDGAGTQYSQYRDKLKFPDDLGDPGAAATITVGDTVEIEGTVYLKARQLTLDGPGKITVSNGLAATVFPQSSTTINCPVQLLNSNMNIAVKMENVDQPANTFESACLTFNSDITVPRIILYCGTLILNGGVTITSSNGSIGSYSAASDNFYGHLQVNGLCKGATGYTIGPDSILSGTGTIVVLNTRQLAVYGRMKPGGFDAPGTFTVTCESGTGYVNFYEGAKLEFRVDLDEDKADKLVLGDNVRLRSIVGNTPTDDIATIMIRVAGNTSNPRMYQLLDFGENCKNSRFLYMIEKDASCKASVSFDEATGLLTVDPPKNAGLILFVR